MNLTREKYSSVVFHLFSRHEQTAEVYRQIVADLEEDDTLRNWFASLAEFRQSLADELRQLIADIGDVPVKPSEEMKSYLDNRENDIIEFINSDNTVGLIELSWEAEESVSKLYQKAEANKDIPLQIREQLDKQHDRLLEVIRKAERFRTVPEKDRAEFKF